MVDGHHGSWTRHQGRNLDGTRVVVRQQRRLIALDMDPVWNSRLLTRRERAPLRKCGGGCLRSATTQVHGAETYAGVTRDTSAGQILRPQIPMRGDVDETGSSCSRPLT